MDSRERLKAIIAGEKPDRCGFWLGHPADETWKIYLKHFGVSSQEALKLMLNDDFRWHCPQFYPTAYQAPTGRAPHR